MVVALAFNISFFLKKRKQKKNFNLIPRRISFYLKKREIFLSMKLVFSLLFRINLCIYMLLSSKENHKFLSEAKIIMGTETMTRKY